MKLRESIRGAAFVVAVLAASLWVAPRADAHSHVSVGIGISVPGVVIGAGNCWRCGYWTPAPVYAAPVYYPVPPPPAYYVPRPVYYGSYYAPYPYPYYYRQGHYRHGYYGDRDRHHRGGGHYRHGHR